MQERSFYRRPLVDFVIPVSGQPYELPTSRMRQVLIQFGGPGETMKDLLTRKVYAEDKSLREISEEIHVGRKSLFRWSRIYGITISRKDVARKAHRNRNLLEWKDRKVKAYRSRSSDARKREALVNQARQEGKLGMLEEDDRELIDLHYSNPAVGIRTIAKIHGVSRQAISARERRIIDLIESLE